MSEFHNAFYRMCPIHEIEYPKLRRCPKCKEKIVYSEEEVKTICTDSYFKGASDQVLLGEFHTIQQHDDSFAKFFEQNKKK